MQSGKIGLKSGLRLVLRKKMWSGKIGLKSGKTNLRSGKTKLKSGKTNLMSDKTDLKTGLRAMLQLDFHQLTMSE